MLCHALPDAATLSQTAMVLHNDLLDMAPADISTTIRKSADWAVGVRLLTNQSNVDLSAWTMQALIYGGAGNLLKTIDGLQTAVDCINFAMTHAETAALSKQNGTWEIWGTRVEDNLITLLVSGRATIV